MVRSILIAVLLVSTFSGCHSTKPGISSAQLSQIFQDRRSRGAMVGISDASSSQYAVEFATPESPNVGSVASSYKYETYLIGKKELDPLLRLKIDRVAINPAGAEEKPEKPEKAEDR